MRSCLVLGKYLFDAAIPCFSAFHGYYIMSRMGFLVGNPFVFTDRLLSYIHLCLS